MSASTESFQKLPADLVCTSEAFVAPLHRAQVVNSRCSEPEDGCLISIYASSEHERENSTAPPSSGACEARNCKILSSGSNQATESHKQIGSFLERTHPLKQSKKFLPHTTTTSAGGQFQRKLQDTVSSLGSERASMASGSLKDLVSSTDIDEETTQETIPSLVYDKSSECRRSSRNQLFTDQAHSSLPAVHHEETSPEPESSPILYTQSLMKTSAKSESCTQSNYLSKPTSSVFTRLKPPRSISMISGSFVSGASFRTPGHPFSCSTETVLPHPERSHHSDASMREHLDIGAPEAEACLAETLAKKKIVQWYSCALSLRILLQGIIYLYEDCFYFHSYFNASTIFGADPTILHIPVETICSIEKQTSAFIFPNAIELTLMDGKKHLLTSFLAREKAYDDMVTLWQKAKPQVACQLSTEREFTSFPAITRCEAVLKFPFLESPSLDFPLSSLAHTLRGVSFSMPLETLILFLMDFQSPACFWRQVCRNLGCQHPEFEPWTPPLQMRPGARSTSEMRYTNKVKSTRVTQLLRVKSESRVCESLASYVYGPKACLIESVIQVLDVPFADSAKIHVRYCFQTVEETTQLHFEYGSQCSQLSVLGKLVSKEAETQVAEHLEKLIEYLVECGKSKHALVESQPSPARIPSVGSCKKDAGVPSVWSGLGGQALLCSLFESNKIILCMLTAATLVLLISIMVMQRKIYALEHQVKLLIETRL